MKPRKSFPKNTLYHRLRRWIRDVNDIRECKEILWKELDRSYDKSESLRSLVVVTTNALHRERGRNWEAEITSLRK